jgi:hypothetical protein
MGNILNGHVTRQLHDISFKGFRIGKTLIRKADGDLPDKAAQTTKNTGDVQFDIDLFSPDWQCMEPASLEASPGNLPALTARASKRMRILFNGKDYCSISILRAGIMIAVNPEPMVQYACGHASTSFMS